MAVEVVGQDEGQKRQATCKNCGAVLSFYTKDIKTKTLYCMGEAESYSYVDCPQCNSQVSIKQRG
jgi:DNA-directed RNA polymerase subunit RPC12/RpoP